MADVRGFRGFRYDLGRVGSLSDVVAPPYDVIDKALQQKLYDQSEHNAIRLELTRDEPGDNEVENKYARAARTIREWVAAELQQVPPRCDDSRTGSGGHVMAPPQLRGPVLMAGARPRSKTTESPRRILPRP